MIPLTQFPVTFVNFTLDTPLGRLTQNSTIFTVKDLIDYYECESYVSRKFEQLKCRFAGKGDINQKIIDQIISRQTIDRLINLVVFSENQKALNLHRTGFQLLKTSSKLHLRRKCYALMERYLGDIYSLHQFEMDCGRNVINESLHEKIKNIFHQNDPIVGFNQINQLYLSYCLKLCEHYTQITSIKFIDEYHGPHIEKKKWIYLFLSSENVQQKTKNIVRDFCNNKRGHDRWHQLNASIISLRHEYFTELLTFGTDELLEWLIAFVLCARNSKFFIEVALDDSNSWVCGECSYLAYSFYIACVDLLRENDSLHPN